MNNRLFFITCTIILNALSLNAMKHDGSASDWEVNDSTNSWEESTLSSDKSNSKSSASSCSDSDDSLSNSNDFSDHSWNSIVAAAKDNADENLFVNLNNTHKTMVVDATSRRIKALEDRLIDYGGQADSNGCTVLHYAASKKPVARNLALDFAKEFLIDPLVDPNENKDVIQKQVIKAEALIQEKSKKMVKLLILRTDLHVDEQDNEGKTALDYAKQNNNTDIINILGNLQ